MHLNISARFLIHIMSAAQSDKVQYSASHEDFVTFRCRLDTATRGPPMNLITYPFVDLRVQRGASLVKCIPRSGLVAKC